MFVSPKPTPPPSPATMYFLDWMQRRVLTVDAEERAERLFQQFAKVASPLKRLELTPQSPPYHAEGGRVCDHVCRMLAGLQAIEHGASLSEVEEFAREKDFVLEFFALEQTLRSQVPFLTAFTLCHDLGKTDACAFDAPEGSKGEAEGFQRRGGTCKVATEPERVRYDKLRRAHEASGVAQSFYEAYGIQVHYPDHAKLGASDEYASTREAILHELQLGGAHVKLLTELLRLHMDIIMAMSKGPDVVKLKAFAAIAERRGLHVPVFLDVVPAALFLDAVLGSLSYTPEHRHDPFGGYSVQTQLMINYFRAEREAMPERHAAREEAVRRGKKLAVRETLKEANIDAETVFEMLKTPIGPVRGEVMGRVHDLIYDPDRRVDFGEHTEELRKRARRAQKLLHERHLSLESL